ncbi:hypothetical protein B0T10DRAFT_534122 [Thelonectria olida]|uniref:Uncharacterized protein n=1 Tax=Thelonectria olida TaxID=1576542 RepID=A0A9P9AHD8_9HYPO|nr:hypothetical protein B0T10DRAFT_534122 [Thelonectria olida]
MWSMPFFLILGTVFAIGHHLFYQHLDGKEALQQPLMLRYGTVLAFCAKASLGAAVILARRQRVWMVVRQKVARLGTIDSIFTAAEDITALFDWEAIRKAKIATCLAIYLWLTPLIVILTSETLSVINGVKEESSLCPEARTLNFTHEDTRDWRQWQVINGYAMILTAWYNSTTPQHEARNADPFDYYNMPSIQAQVIVERAINLQEAVVRKNVASEICTEGWNCSYIVDFVAPGYKCTELANGVGSKVKKLDGSLPPFDTASIIPEGNFSYLALTDLEEYAPKQMEIMDPLSIEDPPYPKYLGAFRTEPVMWIGYATVEDYSNVQPENRSVEGWDNIEFNYTNGIQSYSIKDRQYLRKIVIQPTNYILPGNQELYPGRVAKYRRVAAYHSLGKEFRDYLEGSLRMPGALLNTSMIKTKLLTLPNYQPTKDLHREIPQMYEEIIISLLSDPSFAVVSWAYNGSTSSVGLGGSNTNYPCLRSTPSNFFIYNKTQLCLIYTISIAVALIGVLLGAQAAHQGGMRDVKPSSILRAARAQSLTQVRTNNDQEFKDVKVGFRLVQEHSGEEACGFGLAGYVVQEAQRPLWPFWRPGPRREVPPEN